MYQSNPNLSAFFKKPEQNPSHTPKILTENEDILTSPEPSDETVKKHDPRQIIASLKKLYKMSRNRTVDPYAVTSTLVAKYLEIKELHAENRSDDKSSKQALSDNQYFSGYRKALSRAIFQITKHITTATIQQSNDLGSRIFLAIRGLDVNSSENMNFLQAISCISPIKAQNYLLSLTAEVAKSKTSSKDIERFITRVLPTLPLSEASLMIAAELNITPWTLSKRDFLNFPVLLEGLSHSRCLSPCITDTYLNDWLEVIKQNKNGKDNPCIVIQSEVFKTSIFMR